MQQTQYKFMSGFFSQCFKKCNKLDRVYIYIWLFHYLNYSLKQFFYNNDCCCVIQKKIRIKIIYIFYIIGVIEINKQG